MITIDLPVTLRQMIDARLDSIERALLTKGMGRGDRRQVLSAIEDQILEMLGQSADDEPTRDDVLCILSKLDPPEAYLELSEIEFTGYTMVNTGNRRSDAGEGLSTEKRKAFNILAIIAFSLMCCALMGAFTWWILGFYGLAVLGVVTIGAGICGSVALYQFAVDPNRQQGLWMAIIVSSCAPVIGFLSWITFFVIKG